MEHLDALYATKVNSDDESYRTQETITPLSQAINIPIKADYIMTEFALAASEILNNSDYEGKMVLVCWEHDNIPSFVTALGVNENNVPTWNGDIFDQVWSVTYTSKGKVKLDIIQQALLYGDTSPPDNSVR